MPSTPPTKDATPKTGIVPPPPPPPLPAMKKAPSPPSVPPPPSIPSKGPPGAFLVELLIYNGSPFKDHWAYWVRSHTDPDIGVLIHATGDVKNGFTLEIKRSHDFNATGNRPTARIPLQWIEAGQFDEKAMFNNGQRKIDHTPVCGFEASVFKVKAPTKTLNAADDGYKSGKKVTQRNCQTWIVESANELVNDGLFGNEVATYLCAIEQ